MRKLLLLLTLLAFVASAPLAVAQEKTKKEKPKKISCCVKGKCKSMTAENCDKRQGKVFELMDNCKRECKPEPKPEKAGKK
jgi:hypothetical protein